MVPAAVIDAIESAIARAADAAPLVAISGPVAGGKTTLARAIAEAYDAEPISTDDYFPDYAHTPRLERDDPRHADLDRLAADLASLKRRKPTRVPVWSFFVNRRTDERVVMPGRLVVVEGLFALHATLTDLIDVGVFVDAPPSVRRDRFVARSAEGERGFTVEEADAHFREVAEPTLWKHAAGYLAPGVFRLVDDERGGFREGGPLGPSR